MLVSLVRINAPLSPLAGLPAMKGKLKPLASALSFIAEV